MIWAWKLSHPVCVLWSSLLRPPSTARDSDVFTFHSFTFLNAFFGRRQSLQSLILMIVFVAVFHPVRGLPRPRWKKKKSNILAHFQAVFTVPLINRSSKLVASRSIVVFHWVRDMSCCICKAHRNFPLPQAFELVPKDHALYERRGKSALHKLSHHRRLHRIIPE